MVLMQLSLFDYDKSFTGLHKKCVKHELRLNLLQTQQISESRMKTKNFYWEHKISHFETQNKL